MSATRVPLVGAFRSDDHKYFWMGEEIKPSVTRPLDETEDKQFIIEWGKREVAKAAIAQWPLVEDIRAASGDEAAVKFLAGIPGYAFDTAGKLGGAIHKMTEQIDRGEPITIGDDKAEFITAYRRFLHDYAPKIVSREKYVFSLKHQYAGTYDSIYRIGSDLVLADIKTSKGVYPKTALQLAAYAFAEFIGVEGDEKKHRIPSFDGFAVLHIRPDQYAKGYRLIRVRVGKPEFDAFLAALTLAKHRKQPPPIGETYQIPREEQAA